VEEVQQLILWRRKIEDLWGMFGLLPLVGAERGAGPHEYGDEGAGGDGQARKSDGPACR